MGQTGLHLHVSLEDRQNLNADAIQGELFSNVDTEEIKRGYSGTVASKVAGITNRQLDYWARKQIVEPSITPSHGSGSRRLYSFKDVVILAVSKKLLDAGVNLQNVTAAIGFLTQRSTDQLANVTIMCDRSLRVAQTVKPLLDEYNVQYSTLLRELNGGDYARMTFALLSV